MNRHVFSLVHEHATLQHILILILTYMWCSKSFRCMSKRGILYACYFGSQFLAKETILILISFPSKIGTGTKYSHRDRRQSGLERIKAREKRPPCMLVPFHQPSERSHHQMSLPDLRFLLGAAKHIPSYSIKTFICLMKIHTVNQTARNKRKLNTVY